MRLHGEGVGVKIIGGFQNFALACFKIRVARRGEKGCYKG